MQFPGMSLPDYLKTTQTIINYERNKVLESENVLEETNKKLEETKQRLEKASVENVELQKLLQDTLTQFVPNPKAHVLGYFLDKPDFEELKESVIADLPAVLPQQPVRIIQPHPRPRDGTNRNDMVIKKVTFRKLKVCEQQIVRIQKHLDRQRYIGTDLSKEVLATAFAHAPACSGSAREILISSAIYCFLNDVGWGKKSLIKKITRSSTPSQTLCDKLVTRLAAKKMAMVRSELSDNDIKIYIACDKGNKKGISHFVKYLTYWCKKSGRVRKALLDIDASGGSSAACAEAVDHSLIKIDPPPPGERRKLNGQCTDAGGGGTGASMKSELTKKSRTSPENYLTATCSLHALNLCMSNPISKLFGEGGLEKRNALQLIHSAYNLQIGGGGGMEHQEFEAIYTDLFHEKFEGITCPIMTRWYTVGLGARRVIEEWDRLKIIAKKIRQGYSAESAPNKCASALTSMLAEPALKAHCAFIMGYHEAWWNRQFLWLQSKDEQTRTPGFRSQHMAVRFFVMFRSIENLSVNFQTDNAFEAYRAAKNLVVNVKEIEHLNKIERDFFKIAKNSLVKHFKQWLNQELLPCAIATSEPELSTAFAEYFSAAENISSVTFFSRVHGVEICTTDLIEFVKIYSTFSVNTQFAQSSLSNHTEAVNEIANGKNLYEKRCSPAMKKLRTFVLYTFLPFPVHTQFVESGVKESALVSQTGREEQARTNIAIIRSRTVEDFLEKARKKVKHKVQGNEDKKILPKGWKRNREIITGAKAQHYKVKKIIAQGEKLNVGAFSNSNQEQYKKVRISQTVNKVVNSQTRQDNQAESMRGVTITPYGMGLVRYTWVKKTDIALLRTELTLRSVNFPIDLNITGIKKLLVTDENNRHDQTNKSFKPVDLSMYEHLLAT